MENGGGVIGWGYEISCVLGREGVYTGVYYVNLSTVQIRAMMYMYMIHWLYSYEYTVSNFIYMYFYTGHGVSFNPQCQEDTRMQTSCWSVRKITSKCSGFYMERCDA